MAQTRQNCWEYFHCGREPGGSRANKLGVCPAALDKASDGINHGTHAGRCCWSVAGTFCRGEIQGHFAKKWDECVFCPFYQKVEQQEDRAFVLMPSAVAVSNR